jgi:hypothetical protein
MRIGRLVGAALLGGAVLSVGGCRREAREVPNAFSWGEELAPGTTIHLSTTNGDVTVHGTAQRQAHVHGIKHWRRGRARDVRFVMARSGDDVYVCAIWVRRGGRCGDERHGPRPPRILAVFSLFGRRTDMRASFEVTLPPGVSVDASTVNGRVVVTEAAGNVTAQTVNGDIRATTMGGALALATVNGSIRARAASLAQGAPVTLNTVNGSVTAELPSPLDAHVRLSTVNGHIATDYPVEISGKTDRRDLRGTIGQGGRTVELRTVNGSVELRRGAGGGGW